MTATSSNVGNIPEYIDSPVLYSLFPLLVNSKRQFLASSSSISFQVTARALDGIAMASKEFVTINTRAYHDIAAWKVSSIKLKVRFLQLNKYSNK